MAFGKLLTPVCLVTKQYSLVPAKGGDFFGSESNSSVVESNDSLPSGL